MTMPVSGPADEMHANPDVEAGEYVLGTLTPARQRELVARLPHDSALREQIQALPRFQAATGAPPTEQLANRSRKLSPAQAPQALGQLLDRGHLAAAR